MRWSLVILSFLATAACGDAPTVDCRPENYCFMSTTGEASCAPGTTWRNPVDPDDYVCVPVDCLCDTDAACTDDCACDLDCCLCDVTPGCDTGCSCDDDCVCTPSTHAEARCSGNHLYWYDSCGGREDLAEACGAHGCFNGACSTGWTCEAGAYEDGMVCHCECGIADPDCEDANLFVSGCLFGQICTPTAECSSCGNAMLDDEEECDPGLSTLGECGPRGYAPGQVPCTATCTFDYDACEALSTCGDDQLDGDELCDGVAFHAGIGCNDYGFNRGELGCDLECGIDTAACFECGDGQLSALETCDDGDTDDDDGCTGDCQRQAGWTCAGMPSNCWPTCGDGVQVGGEECDDHNLSNGDGCDSDCELETGCGCSGEPSQCSCVHVETIATLTGYTSFDAASVVLDPGGAPHVVFIYGDDYEDQDGYLMEHAHLWYGRRAGTTWSTSLVETWDQNRSVIDPEDVVVAWDDSANSPRLAYHRTHHSEGSMAVATRAGTAWQLSYDDMAYVYDIVPGSSGWHVVAEPQSYYGLHVLGGTVGNWVRDDGQFPVNLHGAYYPRLAASATDHVFMVTRQRASGNEAYDVIVQERLASDNWAVIGTLTQEALADSCVYPVWVEPVVLGDGRVGVYEEGFTAEGEHWLEFHLRATDGTWTTEPITDLSWLSSSCTGGGASYSNIETVHTVDPLGRPHILFRSTPYLSPESIEHHFRDDDGWHTRSHAVANANPKAMAIDDQGALHLVTRLPAYNDGQSRLAYVRVDAGWE